VCELARYLVGLVPPPGQGLDDLGAKWPAVRGEAGVPECRGGAVGRPRGEAGTVVVEQVRVLGGCRQVS
jgi:hypothetical protein